MRGGQGCEAEDVVEASVSSVIILLYDTFERRFECERRPTTASSPPARQVRPVPRSQGCLRPAAA